VIATLKSRLSTSTLNLRPRASGKSSPTRTVSRALPASSNSFCCVVPSSYDTVNRTVPVVAMAFTTCTNVASSSVPPSTPSPIAHTVPGDVDPSATLPS
jgi:hypothetical protein